LKETYLNNKEYILVTFHPINFSKCKGKACYPQPRMKGRGLQSISVFRASLASIVPHSQPICPIALDDFLLGGNPRTYGYRHTVRNDERQSEDGSAVR